MEKNLCLSKGHFFSFLIPFSDSVITVHPLEGGEVFTPAAKKSVVFSKK